MSREDISHFRASKPFITAAWKAEGCDYNGTSMQTSL